MEVISKINKLKAVVKKAHCVGHKIGFVPTMGALHDGHISLVQHARTVSDIVIASIFVNPTQFGPNEDYQKYPRNLSHDVEILTKYDVDYVFAPAVEEIYPEGFETYIEVKDLSEKLCGLSRPGHFKGVTTVVSKFFAVVDPTYAFFGQKDAQQLAIIKKMVADLNIPLSVYSCPIIRENDGLAMSSRNSYLNEKERRSATVLYRALKLAASLILRGEKKVEKIRSEMIKMLDSEPLAQIDYVEFVDFKNLDAVNEINGDVLIALAVFIGPTRLIDNIVVSVK